MGVNDGMRYKIGFGMLRHHYMAVWNRWDQNISLKMARNSPQIKFYKTIGKGRAGINNSTPFTTMEVETVIIRPYLSSWEDLEYDELTVTFKSVEVDCTCSSSNLTLSKNELRIVMKASEAQKAVREFNDRDFLTIKKGSSI